MTDHLINQCTLLQTQRDLLRSNVLKCGNWPASYHKLIKKNLKPFLMFTNDKDAASNKDIPVVFDRIPKTTLYSELEEEATLKWQEEWE